MGNSANTLVLVHTIPTLVDVFNRLAAELLPGVRLNHIVDEPLLERIRERGHLAPQDAARLRTHIDLAQEIGATAVLVTCSTVSPCVDELHSPLPIPVVKIDEAMIAQAVAAGNRIGAIATASTTLEPTRQALLAQAAHENKQIATEMVLVEDALNALLRGDGATHDALVKQAILKLAPRVDVMVLAQASMARVLDALSPRECPVPVLTSPHTALARVRALCAD